MVDVAGQLAGVLGERAADLLPGRIVDGGRLDDRPEPRERDPGRHRQCGDPGQGRSELATDEQRPRNRVADERNPDEERVRRMDERERARRGSGRQEQRARRLAEMREEEREQSRHERNARPDPPPHQREARARQLPRRALHVGHERAQHQVRVGEDPV